MNSGSRHRLFYLQHSKLLCHSQVRDLHQHQLRDPDRKLSSHLSVGLTKNGSDRSNVRLSSVSTKIESSSVHAGETGRLLVKELAFPVNKGELKEILIPFG